MRSFCIQAQRLWIVAIVVVISCNFVTADEGRKLRPPERRQDDRSVENRRSEEHRRQEVRHRLERDRLERSRLERERIERSEQSSLDRDRMESRERLAIERAIAERNLVEGRLPLGFRDSLEFNCFVRKLNSELIKAGCTEAEVLFQGSSVTGRKYEESTGAYSGPQFDVGRRSDFDIAICSRSLFERAQQLGIEIRSDTRTEPLGGRILQRKLGLDQVSRNLERLAGRPVRFMLFESSQTALQRGPSIAVLRGRH